MAYRTNRMAHHHAAPPSPPPAPAVPAGQCALDEYKGHKLLVLNPADKWPFKFGVSKAKLILEHLDTIRRFVEEFGGEEEAAGDSKGTVPF